MSNDRSNQNVRVETKYLTRSQNIEDLGLEQYVMRLEVDGLCVVPP